MPNLTFWHNTSEEIGKFAASTIAIQPIGSTEQHGKHLPVGTDSLINNAIVNEVKDLIDAGHVPATFLPLLPYGKSNEHLNYPGTITFTAETFMSVLRDIGDSCARAGFKKAGFSQQPWGQPRNRGSDGTGNKNKDRHASLCTSSFS